MTPTDPPARVEDEKHEPKRTPPAWWRDDQRISSVIRMPTGAYCAGCGSLLSQEEQDFDDCFCCGGDGFEEEWDDDDA